MLLPKEIAIYYIKTSNPQLQFFIQGFIPMMNNCFYLANQISDNQNHVSWSQGEEDCYSLSISLTPSLCYTVY